MSSTCADKTAIAPPTPFSRSLNLRNRLERTTSPLPKNSTVQQKLSAFPNNHSSPTNYFNQHPKE
ncbi:MAG: hypothetical protein F6K08_22570 [Okeania sp. SIO1H6]|nr:hypothetical protein [Okeania sp. SIO1H6]